MIERTIDWCNANRFLLFFGVLALVLAGVWSLDRSRSTRCRTSRMFR